jgi:hypothetical protein
LEESGTGGGLGLSSSCKSSCSLGGVLKGDIRSSSLALFAFGSKDSLTCLPGVAGDLVKILGFPARFTGGGTAEETGNPWRGESRSEGGFCGSTVVFNAVTAGNTGVRPASKAGVWEREGILTLREAALGGDGPREVAGLLKSSREVRADNCLLEGESENLGGERGELTVTSGGDFGGDIGPIDTGLNLGVPERDKFSSPPLAPPTFEI